MNRLRLQKAELGQTVAATQQLAEEEAALEAELRGAQDDVAAGDTLQSDYEGFKDLVSRYVAVQQMPEQDPEIHEWYADALKTTARAKKAAIALAGLTEKLASIRTLGAKTAREQAVLGSEVMSLGAVGRRQQRELERLEQTLAALEARRRPNDNLCLLLLQAVIATSVGSSGLVQ